MQEEQPLLKKADKKCDDVVDFLEKRDVDPTDHKDKESDIDKKWDDEKYDYLGDFHSSHVNPIFWKLHGWVDDCIEFWYDVHIKAHPNEVKRKTHRGIEWFEKGNWVIKEDPFDWPGAEHHHHHHDPDEEKVLTEVMKLLEEIDSRESFKTLDEKLTRSNLPTFAKFEGKIE